MRRFSVHKPYKLFFVDEMRYGLMSNHRRSWSPVGERTLIPNQQEFVNRYLFSAIDPIEGESFHLLGWDDIRTQHTERFLCELKGQYPENHLIIVWDNAPFHKPKTLHHTPHTTIIPLPSYAPQLNPVERFFGELRKATANKIFTDGIEPLECLLEQELVGWMKDRIAVQRLCGYGWIGEQWEQIIGVWR